MILSRGRKYLFIHIPKTGGTSMALVLEARALKDDLMLGDTPKARRRRHRLRDVETKGLLWKHSTLADLDGLVSAEELDTLFCFTMVRNPWDRLVSYYHWLLGQNFDHPAVALAARLSFKDFATHPQTIASLAAHPAQSYLTDARGQHRASAYIRLEHLAEDLAPLEAHLGFKLALPHVNRSNRPDDYRAFYDDQTAETVARACARDISKFGYTFT